LLIETIIEITNMNDIKIAVISYLLDSVRAAMGINKRAYKGMKEEAEEAEGAMQSRYSTFKEEAQYVQVAYAGRLNQLEPLKNSFERLLSDVPSMEAGGVGALMKLQEVDTENQASYFIVGTGGAGLTMTIPEYGEVTVVSYNAPLTQKLLSKKKGDKITLPTSQTIEWEVLNVQ